MRSSTAAAFVPISIRVTSPTGDILEAHPFGNLLCVVEATGQQILDALEMGARAYPDITGGFQQVSGITFDLYGDIPSGVVLDENGMFVRVDGTYRVQNVQINGEPLELNKTYTLASHNYCLKNGGDGFSMFQGCNLIKDETMVDYEALIRYITETLGGVIGEEYANESGSGRIRFMRRHAADRCGRGGDARYAGRSCKRPRPKPRTARRHP